MVKGNITTHVSSHVQRIYTVVIVIIDLLMSHPYTINLMIKVISPSLNHFFFIILQRLTEIS